MSSRLYLEHLTDADVSLLAAASGEGWSMMDLRAHLRSEPESLQSLLQLSSVFDTIFASGEQEALLRASPFLAFAVLVSRATRDLAHIRFVEEWVGPGRRVPMFEVAGLQEFASDSLRRLFLSELLASYTHVASGAIWVQTARGWRRRRFSELDPFRLVELIETVPDAERPALYRRLGDLALFLTGVFPDYAARRLVRPIASERLQRVLRQHGLEPLDLPSGSDLSGSFWLLEELGRRSYRLAWEATEAVGSGMARVLGEASAGFGQARRLLNFLTDRYLFPFRERWCPVPERP
jgi:hypothetical protein